MRHFFLVFTFIMMSSCSEKDDELSITDQKPILINVKTYDNQNKLETDWTFQYFYEGNKLIHEIFTQEKGFYWNDYERIYYYKDGKIIRRETFSPLINNDKIIDEFIYDNDQLVKIENYYFRGEYSVLQYYFVFKHLSNNEIEKKVYSNYNSTDYSDKSTIYKFDSNQNLVSSSTINQGGLNFTSNYTHLYKKPFFNVVPFDEKYIISNRGLLDKTLRSEDFGLTYDIYIERSYEYDSNQYPIKISKYDHNTQKTEISTITYK